MTRAREVVVFLGPSLEKAKAMKTLRADYRPPAAQGDVWAALQARPRAIVLIDGVFHSRPSVWHHEIRAALDSGIAVFGASSMGALRAAELSTFGMVGLGTIFDKYQSGEWNDDAHVALLHAGAEFSYRPATIPWVNVWHNAKRATAAGVLARREADRWASAAQSVFYQDRTWSRLLALAPPRARDAVNQFWRHDAQDLKALDAQACLAAVKVLLSGPYVERPIRTTRLSAYATARWMTGAYGTAEGSAPSPDSVRRALIAAWGKRHGVVADPAEVKRWQRHFEARGADPASARRWADMAATEEATLQHAPWLEPAAMGATELSTLERFV